MADARTCRMLADIAAIRVAQRMAALDDLSGARTREAEAEAAQEQAEARTRDAANAWDAHVQHSFSPEFAQAFAGQLIDCGAAGAQARAHRQAAGAASEQSQSAWRDSDARCRQADQVHATSRRALRRDRDERLAEMLADRVTLRWSRP